MSEPTAAEELAGRCERHSKSLASHAAALEPFFRITQKQQDRNSMAYSIASSADVLDECAKALRTRQPADTAAALIGHPDEPGLAEEVSRLIDSNQDCDGFLQPLDAIKDIVDLIERERRIVAAQAFAKSNTRTRHTVERVAVLRHMIADTPYYDGDDQRAVFYRNRREALQAAITAMTGEQ